MSADFTSLNGKRIIIGISGGISSYKTADLVSKLVQLGAIIDVVMTGAATRFITPLTFESLSGRAVFDSQWKHVDGYDPQHIKIAQRADAMLIAPCTMNMLAKLATGFTNDPVSLVISAIDISTTPVLLAPSMNATMLMQPSTQRNIKLLTEDGFNVIPPEEGWQACKTHGAGRLPQTSDLLESLRASLDE
jgi:phosphopantothenoylcysteine decarboxylase/phosphopantothenate--cysteine ligase|tara:strand:- start:966 stop:1538 length:573 start_codon:yes stop_codon:yes gene_type:complete